MKIKINKKGFSLVELMIVVVIMGILVAVAVPLYNAVTDNAERRTCQDNQRSIRSAYSRFVLSDNGQLTNSVFKDGHNSFNGATEDPGDVFKAEFLEFFEDSQLPKCAVDENSYQIKINDDVDIEIVCSDPKHASH